MHSTRPTRRTAGFTLIEVLAVILIIALLAAFLITRLTGAREAIETQGTRAFLATLMAAIEEYEGEKGDYPPSTFPRDLDPRPTRTNMGSEMLVISLFPADQSWRGLDIPDDRLGNSDEDDTKRSLTRFPSSAVFELHDHWQNPIVYLHHRDYAEGADYVTVDNETGETVQARVTAVKNEVTGDYFNPTKVQLLSAGADGVFGTEDDIGNFKPKR